MGSGQSVDSAYGSRRSTGKVRPESWARTVKGGSMRSDHQSEPVIDRRVLEEYMQIEREIAEAQRADPNVLPQFRAKMTELEQVNEHVNQLEAQLKEQPSTAISQERDSARERRSELSGELEILKYKAENLEELHMRQDELLAKIFGGGYGSQRENQLERELDLLEAQRARIMEANFKWRQAQMMMEYACRQLAVAVQKWQDLPDIPTIELEIRYTMPTSARRNLLAGNPRAIESVTQNDQVYQDGPNKEMERVFEAPHSDNPEEAKKQLEQNHEKASSLLRWFEQVLNTTIMQDLAAINRQVRDTTQALKEERIRLIKQKVREIWGDDVHIEIEEDNNGNDQQMDVTLAGITDVSDKDLEQLNDDYMGLDDIDLGQLQTSEEIFGKSYEEFKQELDNMREKHELEMNMFLREQDKQAAKTREGLQAKLEARRKHRAMRSLESKQRSALATGATVS